MQKENNEMRQIDNGEDKKNCIFVSQTREPSSCCVVGCVLLCILNAIIVFDMKLSPIFRLNAFTFFVSCIVKT